MSDDPSSTTAQPDRLWTKPERLPAAVFGLAMAVALVTFMVYGGRNWFFLDEWDFLADRSLGSPDDLLRPHNEHWSTLPVIVYRGMWRVFGLRSYVPYVFLVVALHLTAALLLRVIMRRAGVHPWLATAAAGLFLFLGSGYQNIVWAFQIGFVASLVFGLVHLILIDHDGGFDRRDALGLAAGLAGLMCSGVGVTMVATVALAALLRRGWRIAALHAAPLAAAFGGWWLAYGRDGYEDTLRPSASGLFEYVVAGLAHAMRSAGWFPVIGVALTVVLVGGGALALADGGRDAVRRAAVPIALVGGSILFVTIAGMGRAGYFGVDAARISRYVHLVTAMLVPALALGASAIARRWRAALPILAVLLLVGVPGNLSELNGDDLNLRVLKGNPPFVKALAVVDVGGEVPGRTQPDRGLYPGMTIGWLRAGNRSGRVPDPDRVDPRVSSVARTRLLLEQVSDTSKPTGCEALTGRERLELASGDRFRIVGGEIAVRVTYEGKTGVETIYARPNNSSLVARADLVATVEPFRRRALLCR